MTTLAKTAGRQVARFRTERKLTAQQLSDELKDRLGFEMKRTVIGNLESGYRRTISLAEILALAYVLSVPPLVLIVPLDEEVFEVVPGARFEPWYGASWITGEGVPPLVDQAAADMWEQYEAYMNLLGLYRQHHAIIGRWVRFDRSTESIEVVARTQQEIENALALVRWTIRGRGGVPPRLPAELEGIDQRGRAQRGASDA